MSTWVRLVVTGFTRLAFALVMSVAAAGQESEGKITGSVKDEDGAIVSGVSVSLLLQNQAVAGLVVTDGEGKFTFEHVKPGTYQVVVERTGFVKHRSAVQVTPGDTKELAIALEVVPITGTVTITAEAGQISSTRDIDTAVNVIPERNILERAPEVVAQVVDEEPGVNLQRTSPSLSAVFVRGLTGRNVAVFVDGVRYTTSAQRGGVGTFFSLIEPSTLETVEILRGPNSSQYGSDVHGGVVNFISQAPRYGNADGEFHSTTNIFYTSATNGFGGNTLLSYGKRNYGLLLNVNGRRISTLRPADGLDYHAAVTRFLGLPSDVFGARLPDTGFTQYGALLRANFNLDDRTQLLFSYARNQQDNGKRYDQMLGGDGNNIADLRNLMTDTFYARLFRQNLWLFDNGSFTVSYNGQREERINQGGQGNPTGTITNQRERTNVLGFNFYLDKQIGDNNTFLIGADVYRDKIKAPAFTFDPVTRTTVNSRPRIPNGARYLSYGFYAQDNYTVIPDRLRLNGAVRYNVASYVSRAANSDPGPNGQPLFPDDSARFGAFSGRFGGVVTVTRGFDIAAKYTRGFRAPNTTDLGIIGLVGTGFEVDATTAAARGGFIGSTSGGDAVSTGIPVTKLGPERSDSLDLSFRYTSQRFAFDATGFTTKLNDVYFDQALVLPPGAQGTFLGSEQITAQNARGLVFVAVTPNPVLVRVNFDDARLNGVELNGRARFTEQWSANANFTFIRAYSLLNGLPPNIEGGIPPATGFVSVRYQPRSRFYIEGYSQLAARQNRLSSLDINDRRTGATRTRTNIQNFFRRGACVRGLTTPGPTGCGSGGGILIPTGETLAQVQNRVLPLGSNVGGVFVVNADTLVPLFPYLPGYGLVGVRGGMKFDARSEIFVDFENIFDKSYRGISWGIDGAGRGVTVRYQYRF
ncbi:MAG TPA: TonB-dependent receptor [Pyrinomonadaceae bacterium]|nr:TonB-dependent receptor [Pyrinomonadaceae bacterium]